MKNSLVFMLLLLSLSSTVIAGLDNAGRFDNVVAIYYFENAKDSGPRNFNGLLQENASIVNEGKTNKCLRLRNQDSFAMFDPLFLGLVDREFSITAWVKLNKQSEDFYMSMVGHNDNNSLEGAVDLRILSDGNISGAQYNFEKGKSAVIDSTDNNVANDKWHHIAFTKYAKTLRLFIDAELVKERKSTDYLGFVSDNTFITLGMVEDTEISGSIFIDELAFFETGFSIYEIKGLYNDGLSNFLEAMPVEPQEKVATTWGKLKMRRH